MYASHVEWIAPFQSGRDLGGVGERLPRGDKIFGRGLRIIAAGTNLIEGQIAEDLGLCDGCQRGFGGKSGKEPGVEIVAPFGKPEGKSRGVAGPGGSQP
jgi:hypothetical protein